jgi:hypothetical protein
MNLLLPSSEYKYYPEHRGIRLLWNVDAIYQTTWSHIAVLKFTVETTSKFLRENCCPILGVPVANTVQPGTFDEKRPSWCYSGTSYSIFNSGLCTLFLTWSPLQMNYFINQNHHAKQNSILILFTDFLKKFRQRAGAQKTMEVKLKSHVASTYLNIFYRIFRTVVTNFVPVKQRLSTRILHLKLHFFLIHTKPERNLRFRMI